MTTDLKRLIHDPHVERLIDGLCERVRDYLRLSVSGLEHVPRTGGALVIANHSGFAGLDAIMLCHLIHRETGRKPHILAHRAFFEWLGALKKVSCAFGLEEATVKRGSELLRAGELVLLFPEGESGNFKSSLRRYHLERFHTGFVRMALDAGAPVVCCLVVGAEETHFNVGNIDLTRFVKGLRVPVPINLLPLPARWLVEFEPARRLELPDDTPGRLGLRLLAAGTQISMQRKLNQLLQARDSVYFGP